MADWRDSLVPLLPPTTRSTEDWKKSLVPLQQGVPPPGLAEPQYPPGAQEAEAMRQQGNKQEQQNLALYGGIGGLLTAGLAPASRAILTPLGVPGPLAAGAAEFVGGTAAGAFTGQSPSQAVKGGLMTAGVGVGAELGMNLLGRALGATTSVPQAAIGETLRRPTLEGAGLMRMPVEGANRQAGLNVQGAIEAEQGKLPQMQQTGETPFVLNQRQASVLGEQEATQRMLQADQVRQDFAQQQALRAQKQGALAGRRGELQEARLGAMATKQQLRSARDAAIGDVGRSLESSLSNAEGTLTGAHGTKMELLQKAKDAGVTIDIGPMLDEAQKLVPVKPTTTPRLSAKSELENFIDLVRENYGTDIGDLYGTVHVDPIEADRILQDMRAVSPSTYGEINQPEAGRLFHQLQRTFKDQIYQSILGTGETAQQTYRILNAREGLRNYLSEDNPSGFVKQIVAGGPGTRDRLMALREFEQTHGTGGQFEKSIGEIGKTYSSDLTNVGGQHRARIEAINANHQKNLSMIAEGDFSTRQAAEAARQRQLDAANDFYKQQLDKIGIQQDLAAGRREQAFNKQPSTPEQRFQFGVEEKLRGYLSDQNPRLFVRNFTPGAANEDAVAALRDFEKMSGSGNGVSPGKVEKGLRDLALKNVWGPPEEGQATYWRRYLEKALGKPLTKAAIFLSRPVAYGAAATTAFSEAMSRKEQPSP